MNIEKIDAPSANITLPLNQSVQQANAAQFALMLSLMMESQGNIAADVRPVAASVNVPVETASFPRFNIETSQTRALQLNHMHHFHLLQSLHQEIDTVVDGGRERASLRHTGATDAVLQEIELRKAEGATVGLEAEKIRFAT